MNDRVRLLTNYKLNDYATRLRSAAELLRDSSFYLGLEPQELEEIAAVLEALINSPTRGSLT